MRNRTNTFGLFGQSAVGKQPAKYSLTTVAVGVCVALILTVVTPSEAQLPAARNTPVRGVATQVQLFAGPKTYALLVGVDRYDHQPNLVNPVRDVKAVEKELSEVYGVTTQLLQNPKRAEFLDALRTLAKRKYGPEEQLLVFFSGHGWFDEEVKRGYLALSDSKPLEHDANRDTYVSHEDVRIPLERLDCEHVLLIVDSCFSGTLDPKIALANSGRAGSNDPYREATPEEFIQRKMQYRTRRYITAGGKEYVSDGDPGQHSPFTRGILSALRSFGGEDRILTLEDILTFVAKVVPEPQSGELAGNEPGSSFVLVAQQPEQPGILVMSVTPSDAQIHVAPTSSVTVPPPTRTLQLTVSNARRELPVGRYTVTASKNGYETAREQVLIRSGATTPVNLVLKPSLAEIRYRRVPADVRVYVDYELVSMPHRVSRGPHSIRIERPGYATIRQTESLKPGQRFYLNPQWRRAVVTFEVRSVPSGASVILDGVPQGKTPARVEGVVVGDHRIRLDLEDYEPVEEAITTSQGQRPQTFTLTRMTARVNVISTPVGAVVRSDKGDVDTTPASIDLPLGASTITIEKPGYRPQVRPVDVKRGRNPVVRVELEPQAGTVSISSNPRGAAVEIDGEVYGERTPTSVELPVGTYSVTLTAEDHETRSATVTVRDRQTEVVVADLPHETQLYVTSLPTGAWVWLDGTRESRAPVLLRNVRPGDRKVEVSRQGYKSVAQSFEVKPNVRNVMLLPLRPKSRSAMAIRSTWQPGLGQKYGGRSAVGSLFLVGVVGGGVASGLMHMEYDEARKDLLSAQARYSAAQDGVAIQLARKERSQALSEANARYDRRQIALIATGAVYGLNIIHAFLAGPVMGPEPPSRQVGWRIHPETTLSDAQIVMSRRF